MSLLLVSLNDRQTPIELLERVAVHERNRAPLLATLVANGNLDEVVVVSTCQRTEVYASIQKFHGAVDEITATLSNVLGVAEEEIARYATVEFDRGVTRHLFEVAAGLASVVPGEYEVLGQLRRAIEEADLEGTAGSTLQELFQRSLRAGRHVRDVTTIARGSTSFAQVAIDVVRDEVDDLDGARVVVLGAGTLAANVVSALVRQLPELAEIRVLNRTLAKAEALCATGGTTRMVAGSLDEIGASLRGARVVISAVDAGEVLIGANELDGRESPLLAIDFAMPRSVAPSLAERGALRLVDMATLRARVDATIAQRHEAFHEARELLETAVDDYYETRRTRGAAETVTHLRAALEGWRAEELERRAATLHQLTTEQRDLIEEITRAVVAKIAHRPTMVLKETSGTERGERLRDAVRQLFVVTDGGRPDVDDE